MGCGKSKSLPPSDHPVDDEESNLGGVEKDTELTVRVDNAATPEPQGPLEQASDGVIAAALRQKRKANVVIFGESALGADIPSAKKSVPKSDAVRELITQALHDNVFFAEFGGAELRDLVDAMEPKSEAAGTVVIKQGDPGDNFYVIESGKFEIIVGERKVADWGEGTRNRTFGELALLYNLPRAATVRAVSDSQLWFIDRPTFRSIIARASQAQNERLRSALRRGILEDLTDAQLEALTGAATIVKYKQGDAIVRRGEAGEVFFIIEAGSVICKNLSGDQSNNILTAGDYFGERVLLRREARAADVEALTDVSLIALHREDFETHLGHLRDLLEYNIGMRLLLCTPLIGALSEEARNDMFGCLSVASYADGAVIAAQGRRCDSFFMVKDSSVAVRQLVMAPAGAASASPRLRLSTASRDTLSASGVAVSPPPSGRGPSGSASGSGGGFLTRSFSRANVASTGAATGTSSPQATPRPEAAGAAAAVPPSELKLAAPGGSGSNNTSRADTGGQAAAGAGSGGGQVTVTQELGLLHPGHWFPDRELDADAPLPASFVARGETQVFVLEREAYLRLVAPVKQRLLADGRLRSSTSAYYGTSAGGPAGASAAAGGGPGTPSGAGSPRVSSGGTGPARIASARAPSVSVAGSGSPATTSRGGVAPAADGLPTVSPLARQASDRFAPSGTAAGAAGGKGVATSAAAPAASARGAGPTTDARTARPAGDASSSSQHREGTEERSGAAGASSGGSSSAAAGARTGAGAMPSSSPAGGALPASTARAAGAAPTATPGAAGAPVVPSRPKEARRFSSDFKPPPPGAAGAGAGGVVGAPVPTLPPATRKRLGIPLRELELKKTLGTGTFGRVRLALHRKTNQVFALKMLQKAQIAALKQQRNIMAERDILWRVDHPFIIKLYDTYKDRDRLYMLLELVQGGELFGRLQNSPTPGRIRPEEARFYAACVVDSFEYLHSLHIVYRDLKPENLLIDSQGYLKLVDFGFAKFVLDRTYTLCGTPEYLAPELVLGRGHDKGVDYWAVGVLLFEQVAGYSPFADRAHNDQMVICKNILKGVVDFPSHFRDRDLQNLILQILVKDVAKRLGCLRGGAADIKAHPFFRSMDWDRLRRRELPAPWRPRLAGALDTSNFDEYDETDKVAPYSGDADWDAGF